MVEKLAAGMRCYEKRAFPFIRRAKCGIRRRAAAAAAHCYELTLT